MTDSVGRRLHPSIGGITLLLTLAAASLMALDRSETAGVWDLTVDLTDAQRSGNEAVYRSLPPDECDGENDFDPRARELAERGAEGDLRALRQLEHGGGRHRQSAAARAYVFMAQRAAVAGDRESAASHALHVYLSGAPHRVRMEALRVYCHVAEPAETLKTIQLIESGVQDARFGPMLGELKEARLTRLGERRSER